MPLPAIDKFFRDKSLTSLTLDKKIFNYYMRYIDSEIFEAMPHLQSLSFEEAERNQPRWNALKAKCEERRRIMLGLCAYHRRKRIAKEKITSMMGQFVLGYPLQQSDAN